MGKVDKKILIALGAGLGAAVVATLLFVIIDAFKAPEQAPTRVVEVRVMKALKDIPEGVMTVPEMLGYTTVPAQKMRPDAIVDPVQIANLKTLHVIKEGTVLTKSDFQNFTPTAIPEGFVAMSLQIDTVSGVTWMLKPDDIVDIIGVLRPVASANKSGQISTILLQAIRILAVEAPKAKKDKNIGVNEKGTVTLLMKPEEAQKLMLLSTAGEYTMTLRGGGDDAQRKIQPVSVAQIVAPAKTHTANSTPSNRLVVVEVK